jgi:hypothetical protein
MLRSGAIARESNGKAATPNARPILRMDGCFARAQTAAPEPQTGELA